MSDDPVVTPDHFVVFGGIVHLFAKIEFSLQALSAALANIDLTSALAFTSALGFQARHDAVLNLARIHRPDLVPELENLLQRVKTMSRLRNNMAHSIWRPGRRPGSIKPIGLITRGGNARYIGVSDNEPEWTLEELHAEAAKIERLLAEIYAFYERSGLAAIIEQKIEEASSDSADS